MRLGIALTALALVLASSSVLAQNVNTTLPMHGIETSFGICQIGDPCDPGPPDTNMTPGSTAATYLLVRNHGNVAGVQTAFDFGGNVFIFGLWDCQPNQLSATTPTNPGGAMAGTIATAFDCLNGPATGVVGRLHFVMTGGCVSQVDSSFPFGTHVVSCAASVQPIAPNNRGSVCAGVDGQNACDPVVTNEPPICDAGGPYAGNVGDSIQFDGSGSSDPDGAIVDYAWDFGDGNNGSGATPTHVYAAPGTYAVTLCVTDDAGAVSCCTTEAVIEDVVPVEQASWGKIKSTFDN